MRLIATSIPPKSYGVRVWLDLPPGDELPEDKRPYDFACNLIHIDDDTCEVTQAIGKLTKGVAILIGKKTKELGYKRLLFCRAFGHAATHWGAKVNSQDGLDFYEIDLHEALQR